MEILNETTYQILLAILWFWIVIKLWELFFKYLLRWCDIMPAKQTYKKERKAKGKTVDFEILKERGLLDDEEI